MATWEFFEGYYVVTSDDDCSTHVHISQTEGYSVSDLKKVAQAVIHFEPAFEAVLPMSRRGNPYTKSNWIDNENLAPQNISRAQALSIIDSLTTIDQVVDTMSSNGDRYFGWNFLPIREEKKTIEFRRGAPSTSVNDVFMWVELASSFIQAALTVPTSSIHLQRYPATIRGLRTFISEAKLDQTGMYNSVYLDRLCAGKDMDAGEEPIPAVDQYLLF